MIREKLKSFVKNPPMLWFIRRRINLARREIEDWFMTPIMAMPGEIGSMMRRKVVLFKKNGKNVRLLKGWFIEYPENLTIGDNTRINANCLINAAGGVDIGKNVLIDPHVDHLFFKS